MRCPLEAADMRPSCRDPKGGALSHYPDRLNISSISLRTMHYIVSILVFFIDSRAPFNGEKKFFSRQRRQKQGDRGMGS